MKGHTNNPNGRPTKGTERRKSVTFRITPTAAEAIVVAARSLGVSQSDIIEDYAVMLAQRIDLGWPIPDWSDRKHSDLKFR